MLVFLILSTSIIKNICNELSSLIIRVSLKLVSNCVTCQARDQHYVGLCFEVTNQSIIFGVVEEVGRKL